MLELCMLTSPRCHQLTDKAVPTIEAFIRHSPHLRMVNLEKNNWSRFNVCTRLKAAMVIEWTGGVFYNHSGQIKWYC